MSEKDVLLSIENLVVEYSSDSETVHAVNDVSLQINKGQTLGLVGERTNALLTGEVDLARTIAYVDVPTIDSTDGLEVSIEDTMSASVLFYNCSSVSACDNEELRKAIAFAINNEACKSASYGGYASNISTCTSPRFGDYREAWAELAADTGYYAYNVDKAKECLANAGVAEGRRSSWCIPAVTGRRRKRR